MEYQEKMLSDEIRKLVPVLGRQTAERLSKIYLISDEKTRDRIAEMVDMVKAAVFSDNDMRDSLLVEPPEEPEGGEIRLGDVVYGNKRLFPLSISKEQLLTHMGIFGSSGYGKTNLSFGLTKSLSDAGVPAIIFDFSKRNYRDLLQTDIAGRMEIYTVGRGVSPFRFNPLKPPSGIPVSQWIKEFSSVFDHAYWLMGGGQHIIMKALDSVYETKQNPRLSDLKEAVESMSSNNSRERNWIATASRPLESLCFREVNDVFDCDSSDLSGLFVPGKVTVFELEALSTNDKTFFIEIVLQWLRDSMLATKEREKLKAVVILEEAHHVLNREKSKKLGSETVIDLIFREVRELGIGIVYIDQHPSLVSYPAMGNTSTHVYMNLGLDTKQSSDVQDASSMLGMDYDGDGSHLRRLPVGRGVMLMRNSEFSRPFTMQFDKAGIEKGKIADADVAEAMKAAIKDSFDTAYEPFGGHLSEAEAKILGAVGSGKGLYTSQLYKALKMSGSTFGDNMKSLIKYGLVGQRGVKVKKAKAVYYFLTDAGEAEFVKLGYDGKPQDMSKGLVLKKFQSSGFAISESQGKTELSKDGRLIRLSFIGSYDRGGAYSSLEKDGYYICADEQARNILIQQACRYSMKKHGIRILARVWGDFMKDGSFDTIVL